MVCSTLGLYPERHVPCKFNDSVFIKLLNYFKDEQEKNQMPRKTVWPAYVVIYDLRFPLYYLQRTQKIQNM